MSLDAPCQPAELRILPSKLNILLSILQEQDTHVLKLDIVGFHHEYEQLMKLIYKVVLKLNFKTLL